MEQPYNNEKQLKIVKLKEIIILSFKKKKKRKKQHSIWYLCDPTPTPPSQNQ